MTTAWLLAAAIAVAPPIDARGPRVDRLIEVVDLRADGSATVVTTVSAPAGSGPEFRLHVPAGQPGPPSVRGLAGARVAREIEGEEFVVVLTVPAVLAAAAEIEVSYEVTQAAGAGGPALARGRRQVRYELVNLTRAQVTEAEGTLVLPPGLEVEAMTETTAQATVPGVASLTLTTRDGRAAVTCRGRDVRAGDRLGAAIEFAPPVSRLPLLVGLAVVALAYLYGFRDLTRPKAAPPTR